MNIQAQDVARLNRDAERAQLLNDMYRVAERLLWTINGELEALEPSLATLANAGWPEAGDRR
jgi:hypothetical protein